MNDSLRQDGKAKLAQAPAGIELRGKLLEAVAIRPTREDITRSNLELLNFLLRQNTDPATAETRAKFEGIFEKLLEATKAIATESQRFLRSIGYEPGEVRFYMVGGRVHFKVDEHGMVRPQLLKADSDIDAGISVENVAHLKRDFGDEALIKHSFLESLLLEHLVGPDSFVRSLCKKLGIANEFHFIRGLDGFPERINTPNMSLLLASAK